MISLSNKDAGYSQSSENEISDGKSGICMFWSIKLSTSSNSGNVQLSGWSWVFGSLVGHIRFSGLSSFLPSLLVLAGIALQVRSWRLKASLFSLVRNAPTLIIPCVLELYVPPFK